MAPHYRSGGAGAGHELGAERAFASAMANWFRPSVPQEVYNQPDQHRLQPRLSIQQVLDRNNITELRNFRLVNMGRQAWYQVLDKDSTYHYFSAFNGEFIPDGDRRYALYLARYFLQDNQSPVKDMEYQRYFDGYYQPVNRLLPAWRVSFDRRDGMDVYVETGQSRMGTFNNYTRKALLVFFEQCHTWAFLSMIGGDRFRLIVLLIVVGLMFLSLVSGITVYGLFWNRFKDIARKQKARNEQDKRFVHRFHRQLGLIVSLVMFTFVLSGAFHLVVKLYNARPQQKPFAQLVNTKVLSVSNLQLPLPDSAVKRTTLVQFNGHTYYQVLDSQDNLLYFDTQNGQQFKNGDTRFAVFLTDYYGNTPQKKPEQVTLIKQFDEEYGFINKRLPVQRVGFAGKENWYIETSTAKLALKVAGIDRVEGLSFIFLHKYFGMTWAGKNVRDVVSMLAALGILVTALFGFSAFWTNR